MTGTDALAAALAGEYAAIYAYGAVGARLDRRTAGEARAAELAHRDRRDTLLLRLAGAPSPSATPPAAQPAYELPFPVTDRASAIRLAVYVEERMAGLWRAALRDVAGEDRRLALDGLTGCAVRATRFRRVGGLSPLTVPFPGRAP